MSESESAGEIVQNAQSALLKLQMQYRDTTLPFWALAVAWEAARFACRRCRPRRSGYSARQTPTRRRCHHHFQAKGHAMTTLIDTYNSEGCTGRCDAKCYAATTGSCDCICGGRNTCTASAGGSVRCMCHGAGIERAMENTRELAEEWLVAWKPVHPDTVCWNIPAAQLPLPL